MNSDFKYKIVQPFTHKVLTPSLNVPCTQEAGSKNLGQESQLGHGSIEVSQERTLSLGLTVRGTLIIHIIFVCSFGTHEREELMALASINKQVADELPHRSSSLVPSFLTYVPG